MNIGSLYFVKRYFWLLFPTEETAVAADFMVHLGDAPVPRPPPDALALVVATASYWSKRFNCEVTYFPLDSYIVFLEEDGPYKKVLTSEGLIGWTCFVESYNDSFEEVNP